MTLELAFQTTFQGYLSTWKKFLDMKSLKKYTMYSTYSSKNHTSILTWKKNSIKVEEQNHVIALFHCFFKKFQTTALYTIYDTADKT